MELESLDKEIIETELACHERVRQAIRDAALAEKPDMSGIQSRLKELRDEAINASARDLPSLFQMMNTNHSLASRDFDKQLPDLRAPYFGRLVLEENGRKKEILIGHQTFIDADRKVTIVDWKHAAIAQVFFNFREGEEYDIELPGRLAEGTVLLRHVISFDVGELVGIGNTEHQLHRAKGSQAWQKTTGPQKASFAGGSGAAVGNKHLGGATGGFQSPEISALLDRNQYDILTRDENEALLVLGGAGCGKTTISLHRMAVLNFRDGERFSQSRMRVIVPEEGLVHLTKRLLRHLNLNNTPVSTFDAWISSQGRKILRGVPKRVCQETPPRVMKVKRHELIRDVIELHYKNLIEKIQKNMSERLQEVNLQPFFDDPTPFWLRLQNWEKRLLKEQASSATVSQAIKECFKDSSYALTDFNDLRAEIFGADEYRNYLVEKSSGEITEDDLRETILHIRKQFIDPDGGQISASERRNLKEIDGSDLSDDPYYRTVDVEDFSILLWWVQLITGNMEWHGKGMSRVHHLLLDEAQELAPIELNSIAGSFSKSTSVTIAGDDVQQSDPTVSFLGWNRVTKDLGLERIHSTKLETNYRCPRPIAELSHKVLGSMAPAQMPKTLRDGRPVTISHYLEFGVAMVELIDVLEGVITSEPAASVCIICRDEESAIKHFEGLNQLKGIRLVVDGAFSFEPGIDVADVSQIKGLEFDYVVIPDANIRHYNDNPIDRRALHVAITRAVHQLWIIQTGVQSPIL